MITTEQSANLVVVTVFGEFTITDFKEFEDVVNYKVQFEGPVSLLFDLRQMLGVTLDVAWEEIQYSRKHPHDFRRIAVLTEDQWVTWSAWISQMYVEAEVQVFVEELDAREWLAEVSEEPTR